MKRCFFRRADFDYRPYEQVIHQIVRELIAHKNVTVFYSGGRGNFDILCAKIVSDLHCEYPHIRNIKFPSYLPTGVASDASHSLYYTGIEYFLEKHVVPRFAIIETNKLVIDACNYVVSGVCRNYGRAQQAIKYAKRKEKNLIDILSTTKQLKYA